MDVTAIVLAAGASERMGVAKPFLFVGERRVIDAALEACTAAARTIVVLGKDAKLAPGKATVVVNEHPEQGPISSLKLALRAAAAKPDHYLLLPADYPLVERDDVLALLAAARAPRAGAKVRVPVCRGRRGHPVLFAGSLAPELLALGQGGTARDVLWRDPRAVEEVETAREGVLIDIDTPFDLGRADALQRRREIAVRLRGEPRLRIALGRRGGVLTQDVYRPPKGPDLTITKLKLEGGLTEEWQVSGAIEFAAAIHVRPAKTAFLIATSPSPEPLPLLARTLAAEGCRELVAPSMRIEETGEGGAALWQPHPDVNGLVRKL